MPNPGLPSRRDIIGAGSPKPSGDGTQSDDPADIFAQSLFDRAGPLITYSQNAMGCEFQVICSSAAQGRLANLMAGGFQLVQELEQMMTIYQPHSQVSLINRSAGSEPVVIDRGLFELLKQATQISEITEGAFDITSGPLSKLWGSHRRQGAVPNAQDLDETLKSIGTQYLQFNDQKTSVQLARPEIEIDLGGIGKGYALDRLCTYFESAGASDFVIHGGQSSVVARGCRSAMPGSDSKPWTVAISHPIQPQTRLATLRMSDQAIGTSGSGRQSFIFQGRRYGHVIDPRSGWPADQLLSATVLAPTAMLADALATAIFVMGREGAQRLCSSDSQLSAIVIDQAKKSGQLQIDTFNIADDQIQLLI